MTTLAEVVAMVAELEATPHPVMVRMAHSTLDVIRAHQPPPPAGIGGSFGCVEVATVEHLPHLWLEVDMSDGTTRRIDADGNERE